MGVIMMMVALMTVGYSQQAAVVLLSRRIHKGPRFLIIRTDGQKPDSRGRSVDVRVGRTLRIIIVMRVR